jgi:RNA polymerase sigma-70 factor (ECF subfamily)
MAEMTCPSQGDSSAGQGVALPIDWAATLAEHERWLRTVVFARLGERQAVDEVMQEVALAAVAQRAPLRNLAGVAAWLYRLALRQVLLYRRRCGRQRKLLGKFAESRTSILDNPAQLDPLDQLLQTERCALVRQALGKLTARDAEILLLKYTENWSYQELAVRLGVSESAIEARLYRARQRLREAIVGTHLIETTP